MKKTATFETALWILLILILPLTGRAQENPEKKSAAPEPAKEETKPKTDKTEPKTLAALLEEARTALDKVEADKSLDRLPVLAAEWAGKIEKYLSDHPGEPEQGRALPFLVMLEACAPDGAAKIRALYDRVKENSGNAPWWEAFLREIFYQLHGKDPKTLLEILADAEGRAGSPDLSAAVLYYRAVTLTETGKGDEARPVFTRIVKEFNGTPYAQSATGHLQDLDRLRPGMAAPEVKLPGLSGAGVTLSALKGKIVILFFWTSRSALLVERAAVLKDLANRHKADPFALVGVCLDPAPHRQRAARKAAELGMTWPNGFDGKGIDGPAARAYGTALLPRTLLLDAQGKILVSDLFLHGNAGFLVNDAVTKLKAEIQKALAAKKKAEEAKKKAEEAKKKAAAPPKAAPKK